MNKIKFYFLLLLLLLISFNSFSNEDIYSSCGPRPGIIDRLIGSAEKIRLKCIDDIYNENNEKIKKEVADLYQISQQIKAELASVGAITNYNMIDCSRSAKQLNRCNELVGAQQLVIERIDELMGWNEKLKRPSEQENSTMAQPPCPTKEMLDKIKPVRYYNRKLYKSWEKCVVLAN